MSLLDIFRSSNKTSASVAKERLQVIVAHQRGQRNIQRDYLPRLQQELLQVIRKYVAVSDDAVRMEVEREGDLEVLELNIVLPEEAQAS
jgi:cell division topological specificity factor